MVFCFRDLLIFFEWRIMNIIIRFDQKNCFSFLEPTRQNGGKKRMIKRHLFFYKLFYWPVMLFLKLKLGYTYTEAKELPEKYIVLSNHNTDYDPLLVAASFKRQMYFVASEHIARWKLVYKFLRYGFEPIVRYKGTVAASTVKEVLRKLKAGSNVCIFAEGNRSWDGVTGPILPSTGKVVKTARCGLVTYRIRGGYFATPRWGTSGVRRGYLHGAPVNVYTEEQIAAMSVDEINAAINRDLYEDAYETQLASPKPYKGKGLAEGMENLLFVCPGCGAVDTITTHGDTVECTTCGMRFRYDEYGMLEGAPFDTVRDLSRWQEGEVAKAVGAEAVYTAKHGTLTQITKHEENLVAQGAVSLSVEALTCGETVIPMEDITNLAIHGKRGIVFSTSDAYYELIPDSNALKFVLFYECCKRGAKIEA